MAKIFWTILKANPLPFIIGALMLAGAVGGSIWYVQGLQRDLADMKLSRDAETRRADDNFEAAKASESAAKSKIAALERNESKSKARAETLSKTITDIEVSNEKIDCPMPDFVRRAFGVGVRDNSKTGK